MGVGKVLGRVTRGPQVVALGMAVSAAKRCCYLDMAYQTIGHLREIVSADLIGFRDAAMTSAAGVGADRSVELAADVTGRLQVFTPVDRIGE